MTTPSKVHSEQYQAIKQREAEQVAEFRQHLEKVGGNSGPHSSSSIIVNNLTAMIFTEQMFPTPGERARLALPVLKDFIATKFPHENLPASFYLHTLRQWDVPEGHPAYAAEFVAAADKSPLRNSAEFLREFSRLAASYLPASSVHLVFDKAVERVRLSQIRNPALVGESLAEMATQYVSNARLPGAYKLLHQTLTHQLAKPADSRLPAALSEVSVENAAEMLLAFVSNTEASKALKQTALNDIRSLLYSASTLFQRDIKPKSSFEGSHLHKHFLAYQATREFAPDQLTERDFEDVVEYFADEHNREDYEDRLSSMIECGKACLPAEDQDEVIFDALLRLTGAEFARDNASYPAVVQGMVPALTKFKKYFGLDPVQQETLTDFLDEMLIDASAREPQQQERVFEANKLIAHMLLDGKSIVAWIANATDTQFLNANDNAASEPFASYLVDQFRSVSAKSGEWNSFPVVAGNVAAGKVQGQITLVFSHEAQFDDPQRQMHVYSADGQFLNFAEMKQRIRNLHAIPAVAAEVQHQLDQIAHLLPTPPEPPKPGFWKNLLG